MSSPSAAPSLFGGSSGVGGERSSISSSGASASASASTSASPGGGGGTGGTRRKLRWSLNPVRASTLTTSTSFGAASRYSQYSPSSADTASSGSPMAGGGEYASTSSSRFGGAASSASARQEVASKAEDTASVYRKFRAAQQKQRNEQGLATGGVNASVLSSPLSSHQASVIAAGGAGGLSSLPRPTRGGRKFLGQAVASRRIIGGGGGGGGGGTGGGTGPSRRLANPERNRRAMGQVNAMSQSWVWRWLTAFCSVVLLFGQPVQLIFCPSSWDMGFAVLYVIVLVVLATDIVLHCILDPTYFLWYCQCCQRSDAPHWCRRVGSKESSCCYVHSRTFIEEGEGEDVEHMSPGSVGQQSSATRCQFGSFIFWLDLLSTVSLIPEIPFFNSTLFEVAYIYIRINDAHLLAPYQLTGLDITEYITADIISIFFTIGRTCRLARFVSASSAIRLSETFNVYYFMSYMSALIRGGDAGEDADSSVGARSVRVGSRCFRRIFDCGKRNRERRRVREFAAVRIQRAWRSYKQGDESNRASVLPARRKATAANGMTASYSPFATFRNSSSFASRRSSSGGLRRRKDRKESSQVGTAMRELTAQRVAVGILCALIFTAVFTYGEVDSTNYQTMLALYAPTLVPEYSSPALVAARNSTCESLFEYQFVNGTTASFDLLDGSTDPSSLRPAEIMHISIFGPEGTTHGRFSIRNEVKYEAVYQLVSIFFILSIWIIGVAGSTGPVMTLVLTPIERMNRLLAMLTKDPLGYQSTPKFKQFLAEEFEVTKKTQWTEHVLMGMETSFLMSTIFRIGSLMRVGFGSAGVEIIRENLQKGSDGLVMNHAGSTVHRIFLFCDIRQFTDATEALQEEVFVFTNRIASVVHSICASYGGSANKNVGDAFLMSWRLDDGVDDRNNDNSYGGRGESARGLVRSSSSIRLGQLYDELAQRSDQADRALFSVIKVCLALYRDDDFLVELSDLAKEKLKEKIKDRQGPVVQMGFGLHAGKAVQGAIGSQRKIDPTYLSEHVDMAETLESSTKRYGLKMLMSGAFHELLSPRNRGRCRKIDQLVLNRDEGADDDVGDVGEVLELFTFDLDVDALHEEKSEHNHSAESSRHQDGVETSRSKRHRRASILSRVDANPSRSRTRRQSRRVSFGFIGDDGTSGGTQPTSNETLPTGLADVAGRSARSSTTSMGDRDGPRGDWNHNTPYSAAVWMSEEMRTIRKRYTDGLFYQYFNSGLQSYLDRDWEHARQCFSSILERFEDGPSRYFMNIIEENKGVPPKGFAGYGSV